MTKPITATLQVHSCFASMSSNDVFLYRVLDAVPEIKRRASDCVGSDIVASGPGWAVGFHVDQGGFVHQSRYFTTAYLSDKTLYSAGLRSGRPFSHRDPEDKLEEIVAAHVANGWLRELPAELKALRERERAEDDAEEKAARRIQGYVFPDGWSTNLTLADYRGSIPEDVWADAGLQKYLAEGGCHGYVGHYSRTHASDEALCRVLRENGWTPRMTAEFMTCRAGRHFADQLSHENVDSIGRIFQGYDPSGEPWFVEATQPEGAAK